MTAMHTHSLGAGALAVLGALELTPLSRWSRAQLVAQTGLSDRAVRQAIRELRRGGIAVVSDSQASGYWLARSAAEVEAVRQEYIARIRDQAATCRALRETAAAMQGAVWDGAGEAVTARLL